MTSPSQPPPKRGSEPSSAPHSLSQPKTEAGWLRHPLTLAGLLILLVLAAYLPALRAGFIWDDDAYVTQNPLLTAPHGLREIWFSTDKQSQYFPLVYTTFRLEHALWGFDPLGYHLVNVLLHALNAILVWFVLNASKSPPPGCSGHFCAAPRPGRIGGLGHRTEEYRITLLFARRAGLAGIR